MHIRSWSSSELARPQVICQNSFDIFIVRAKHEHIIQIVHDSLRVLLTKRRTTCVRCEYICIWRDVHITAARWHPFLKGGRGRECRLWRRSCSRSLRTDRIDRLNWQDMTTTTIHHMRLSVSTIAINYYGHTLFGNSSAYRTIYVHIYVTFVCLCLVQSAYACRVHARIDAVLFSFFFFFQNMSDK